MKKEKTAEMTTERVEDYHVESRPSSASDFAWQRDYESQSLDDALVIFRKNKKQYEGVREIRLVICNTVRRVFSADGVAKIEKQSKRMKELLKRP